MTDRRKSHGENYWATAPGYMIRCHGHEPNGKQCRREADLGSVVCERHGGAAPQVIRRARERIALTADDAVQLLLSMMKDESTPAAVRLNAIRDVLDRGAVVRSEQIQVTGADPVGDLYRSLLVRENLSATQSEGDDDDDAIDAEVTDYPELEPSQPEPEPEPLHIVDEEKPVVVDVPTPPRRVREDLERRGAEQNRYW